MRRHWSPCRVCGVEHTNPISSSICSACGAEERAERERAEWMERQAYEESPFGQFMSLSEEERWRVLFEHMRPTDDTACT
jgi:ribosomal protein L37E